MNKIDKLTKEQTDKFPAYVKHWVGVGISTEGVSKETTEEIIRDFRESISFEKNVPLVITKNPLEAWVACCLLKKNSVDLDDLDEEMKAVFEGNPKKRDIEAATLPFASGSFFAATFAFYSFMLEELGIKDRLEAGLYDRYKKWERTSQLGCIYPFEDLTVVCEKPLVCKLNERGVVHCEDGPAIAYSGYGDLRIFALNGIVVPEYLVMTPAEELDKEFFNKETNADIRAEFVRKVGVEFFLEHGQLIDSYENYDKEEHPFWHESQYELWDLKFLYPRLDKALHLKMLNQTTGIWHVEPVAPSCENLEQAIKDRFGGKDLKIVSIS